MYAFRLRAAAVALVAGVGLTGCMSPYGYNGVSVGAGTGGYYGDYGYGGYGYGGYPAYGVGYGYGAGYPGYGYGYAPYYGWYDDFYYPGSGYYVYDRYRQPHRWTDAQRRYWEARRDNAMSSKEFRRQMEARQQNWDGFAAGPTAVTQQVQTQDGERVRVERDRPIRGDRANRGNRADRIERTQSPEQFERAQRSNQVERAQRSNQVERAQRANQVERAERTRPERAQRIERQSSREFRNSMSNRGNSERSSSDSNTRED